MGSEMCIRDRDNEAELKPESGFNEGKWLSANYVAKITGLLYNDLTGE